MVALLLGLIVVCPTLIEFCEDLLQKSWIVILTIPRTNLTKMILCTVLIHYGRLYN